MRIEITSIFVDNQDKALAFYTDILGFDVRENMPAGPYRWITVISPEQPRGAAISIEPADKPYVQVYQKGAFAEGVPLLYLSVDDCEAEYQRLKKLGVKFTVQPMLSGPITMAVFDDTCGNLVMIGQVM